MHPLATFSETVESDSLPVDCGPRVSPVGCEDDNETSSTRFNKGNNKIRQASENPCQDSEMTRAEEEDEVFTHELDTEIAQPLPNAVVSPTCSGSVSIIHPTIASAEERDHPSTAVNVANHLIHSTTSTGGKVQSVCSTFTVGRMGSHWRGKTTVTKAVRQMKQVSRVPAFIPGRVLLIEEKCSTARRLRSVVIN